MLTSAKISSLNAKAYALYVTSEERELGADCSGRGVYYAGEGEWQGSAQALEAMGLAGVSMDAEAIESVLDGRDPATGRQVRRRGANKAVNSHDLTFAVPKSMSVLWAGSSVEQRAVLEQVMQRAHREAMCYLVDNMACVHQRVDGDRTQRERVLARELVYGTVLHRTARPTPGADPDPHLHIHTLIVGAICDSDGRVVTPDSYGWRGFRTQEIGGVFEASLARQLRELGLPARMHARWRQGFSIEGIDETAVAAMSKRSQQVQDALAQFRAEHDDRDPSHAEKRMLSLVDRQAKRDVDVGQLEMSWAVELTKHGIDVPSIWNARERQRVTKGDVTRVREALLLELSGHSTVTDEQLRQMAYRIGAGALSAGQTISVVEQMRTDGVLITLENGYVTSADVREAERLVIDSARMLTAEPATVPKQASRTLSSVVEQIEQSLPGSLSAEQREAAQRTSVEGHRLNIVVGQAGTGKGEVIRTISAAAQQQGQDVLVTAVAGVRAQEAGGDALAPARTIASMLARMDQDNEPIQPGGVLIVDEAGMVSTHQLWDLLERADERDLQVVLVGDPAQIQAIGAGGMLTALIQEHGCVELTEVHRQRHAWMRDAALAIREARSRDAIELYQRHDALHMPGTTNAAIAQMVDAWDAHRHEHKLAQSLMIVHDTNTNVDLVNLLAQERRLAAGELGERSTPSPDRDYHLHERDLVIFRDAPYQPSDGSRRVENGTRGQIRSIDDDGTLHVLLQEPGKAHRTIQVDPAACASLRLAYASHTMPAQGVTVERSYELLNPTAINRHNAYVGASRARERHDVFVPRDSLDPANALTDTQVLARLANTIDTRTQNGPSITHAEVTRTLAPTAPPRTPKAWETPEVTRAKHQHATLTREAEQLQQQLAAHNAKRTELAQDLSNKRTEAAQADLRFTAAHTDLTTARERVENKRLPDLRGTRQRTLELATEEHDAAQSACRAAHSRLKTANSALTNHDTRAKALAKQLDDLRERVADAERAIQFARDPNLAKRELAAIRERNDARDGTVMDDLETRREIDSLVRANPELPELRDHLGTRPTDPTHAKVWDSAATQLLEYRTQHHITDTKTALGPPPRDHKAMRDYTGALTAVTQAAQKLGHQATKPLAPDLTQQQHAQQLEREALHRTRSRGLER